jgi:copper transporter 1
MIDKPAQMLWNWDTIDACFLTRSWHVRSAAGFAGTCILAAALVLALEFLRRVAHEYDAGLARGAPPGSPSHRVNTSTSERAATDEIAANDDVEAAASDKAEGASAEEDAEHTGGGGSGPDDATARTTPLAPRRRPRRSAIGAAGWAMATAVRGAGRVLRGEDLAATAVRALLHTCQFAVAYFIMLLAMYYNGYVLLSIFAGAFVGAFLFGRAAGERGLDGEATYCCG